MLIPKCEIHCLVERIPSNHELLVSMKLELTLFTSYADAYHKVANSIYWNDSNAATKSRIRAKLNRLAYDAMDSFWEAVKLFNQYCDEMDTKQIPPPQWTIAVAPLLNSALRYLEKYHNHQINSIQLTLFK